MKSKEFASLIVQEIVDKNPPDSRLFISGNGINVSNLGNKDEIWKAFVRYNIDAYGVRSSVVAKYWKLMPEKSLIKQRKKLIEATKLLKKLECYNNFTYSCPVTYRSGDFVDEDSCHKKDCFDQCPVINIIKELAWHRAHYKIAKIIVEDAKRLLIENPYGKINGNLNDVVNGLLNEQKDDDKGKTAATRELLALFKDMKGYGTPPKAISWFFSELSSPVHQVDQWPNLDYNQLTPVDTHVKRLMIRFKFINSRDVSTKDIEDKLLELYPSEHRKLDFALYRLGGESEEDICGKTPNCELCKGKHPIIWKNCKEKSF